MFDYEEDEVLLIKIILFILILLLLISASTGMYPIAIIITIAILFGIVTI